VPNQKQMKQETA